MIKKGRWWYWMIVVAVTVDVCYSGNIEVVDVPETGKIDVEVNPIFQNSYKAPDARYWNGLKETMGKAMDALEKAVEAQAAEREDVERGEGVTELHHIADNIGEPKEKRSMWGWRGEEVKGGTMVFALVEYHHTNEVSKVKSILKAIVKEKIQKYDDFPGQITCTYPSVGEKQGKSGAGVHLPKDKDGIGVSVGLYIYFPTAEFPVLDLATERIRLDMRKDGTTVMEFKSVEEIELTAEEIPLEIHKDKSCTEIQHKDRGTEIQQFLLNVETEVPTLVEENMPYYFQWHAGKLRATYQDPSANLAGPLKALLYHMIRILCHAILHSNGCVSSASIDYVSVSLEHH